jgi:hypothetical protein
MMKPGVRSLWKSSLLRGGLKGVADGRSGVWLKTVFPTGPAVASAIATASMLAPSNPRVVVDRFRTLHPLFAWLYEDILR